MRLFDDTPWETIAEFRGEADSRETLTRLRRWTTNIGKQELSPRETAQEIDYLISQYEKYMNFHRIKCVKGTFMAVVTVAAEILENLARLRLTKAVSAIASINQGYLDLQEAELTARTATSFYFRSPESGNEATPGRVFGGHFPCFCVFTQPGPEPVIEYSPDVPV